MPGSANFLDDVSDDLANWIDSTATDVALAFAPARAPFSANITEDQKLEFYRTRLLPGWHAECAGATGGAAAPGPGGLRRCVSGRRQTLAGVSSCGAGAD